MGASEWRYFTPYQPDIQQALQQLRENVYRQGRYYMRPAFWRTMTFEEYLPPDPDLTENDRAYYFESFQNLQALKEPTSIETLIEWNGEEGTHSILDMDEVVDRPLEPATLKEWQRDFCPPGEGQWPAILEYMNSDEFRNRYGKVYPLLERQLLDLFNTLQPTHQKIEEMRFEIGQMRDHGVGLYIIVYRDGEPEEIYFSGFSGD